MAKIGRNQACPCGSGKKYKQCCLRREQEEGIQAGAMAQAKISLQGEIGKIQQAAAEKTPLLRELGVFIFFCDEQGDAWVFEVTESDAVQVARGGEPVEIELDENPETIEINWTHTFSFRDKRLYLKAYADKSEQELAGAPVGRIRKAIKRMYKRYPPEVLRQVHLQEDESRGN